MAAVILLAYYDSDKDVEADEADVRHNTRRCWNPRCEDCPVPRIRYAETGTRHEVREVDGHVRVISG